MSWVCSLCVYFFMSLSCGFISQASAQIIKDNSTSCYLEEFLDITNTSYPLSLSEYPGNPLSFLVGTMADIVVVDDEKNLSNIQVMGEVEIRGMVGDADNNLLITTKSKCVILSYDIVNDTVMQWAGLWDACGNVSGSLASSRFGFLYDIAADANRMTFYVIEDEANIKVIRPDEDKVQAAVSSLNFLLALAVTSDGNVYFSANNAIYLMNKDDYTYSLVIGGKNEPGHIDGSFNSSRFKNITALEILSNLIIAADPDNGVLRKINTAKQTVSSICAGTLAKGYLYECKLTRPTNLLPLYENFLILDGQAIKTIKCSARTTTSSEAKPAGPETVKYSVQPLQEGKQMLTKEDEKSFACQGQKVMRKETDQQVQCMMECMLAGCHCLEIGSNYCDIFIS